VPQDYTEAVRWYREAADQGDTKAQVVLGNMYYYGHGVPQDYVEAVRWYRKAANQGDKTVQAALTIVYFKGQGVPRNYIEATRWFGKVVASCFAKTQGGSLARWMSSIVGILSALLILVVPKRRWGRATWLPQALVSTALAARLAHELLRSESFSALLARGLLGLPYKGFGPVLWLALLAVGSAIFAIGAVMEAVRGSKRGGDQGQPATPVEGTLDSHT